MLRGGARRAEHRDRAPDLGERVEAARELAGDVPHALGVRPAHRGVVAQPQQELLVEGLRLLHSGSVISTAPKPSSGPSTKKISIVMSGSTWAWLRKASTLRPVRSSIVCL